ncbi:MAG: OsmC family protein [Humidesulfovibrio sp.]|nr:OsmC family protein [Humidesulfovibrio sp.]
MITSTNLPENFMATFTDGTHEALVDTPVSNGSKFAGFTPPSLLEASLATCINLIVRVAAENHGIPLAGIKVQVSLNTANKDETVFEYSMALEGELTDDQRTTLRHAANGCPVKKILSGAVSFKDKSE